MHSITNTIGFARHFLQIQTKRWFVLALSLLISIGSATLLVGHASATTPQAVIGMPFSGKWAWNVLISPPYTDSNSSYPSVHHTPGGGDWATDVYAAEGTAVKLSVPIVTGTLSFSWKATSTSCGQSTGINISVNGTNIGWLYYAHLNNAVTSGVITNGMTLGTVHDWVVNGVHCNPGVHVHTEFKNTTNYSCYVDNGQAGVTLSYGTNLAVLGSSNTGAQQVCGSVPSSSYPDGTYLHATDSGGVYVMAGGAPMYVSSWANVGGSHPYTDTTQAYINSLPTYPRDGTYIHAYTTGGVYTIAGGAPMYVSSWANVGGSHPYTDVDAWVITNQLRQYPFDGTYLHAYTTGGIYVVAGGSPMYVSSWSNVGGTHPDADIDVWDITNQLRQYPLNGTYIRAYTTSAVYVIAGGAPLYVSNWTTVGGTHHDTDVDVWVIANQLRQHPSDGTYVQPYGNAAIYEAAGGAALSVSTWSNVGGPYPVTTIPSDSLPQFLSYPQDGTYVKGYQSGEEFEAMSGAVSRITTTPLPSATSVDDWAIVNQLGGVE